jgi:trk system potassium uptake protein TrkH
MHKRLVFSIISRVVFIVSVFMLFPLAWAASDSFYSLETNAFIVAILAGLLCAVLGRCFFSSRERDFEMMNAKDGLAIVGLAWIVSSGIGALPLWLSGVGQHFTDAYFEIASGFTTTGASILTDIEVLPRGILFWRSLTHWLGGMGIVVLFVALLPSLGYNAYHLYRAEAPGVTSERILPRIKETAKLLWEVYVLLSAAQTALLMYGGMSFFDAACHTFGTMATGGFSTKNASIAAFSPFVQWVVVVFMILAGMNFLFHVQLLRGRPASVVRNEEFRVYFWLIVGASVIFSLVLWQTQTVGAPIRHGVFQVVSIMTTTGYVTADFNLWPGALRFGLLLLMFVGGCGGSTGGGMKVSRVVLSLKIAARSIQQGIFPSLVAPVRFNGKSLSAALAAGVAAFFILYMMLFLFGAALLLAFENCDIVTALSASLASLSNIGPGLNMVGAAENYAWMSVPGKWVCVVLMLAGRLELYAILILFLPQTWRK